MHEGQDFHAPTIFDSPSVRRHETIEMCVAELVHTRRALVGQTVEPDHRRRIVKSERDTGVLTTTVPGAKAHVSTVRNSSREIVDSHLLTCVDSYSGGCRDVSLTMSSAVRPRAPPP